MTRYHAAAFRQHATSTPSPTPPADRRDLWRCAIAADRGLKAAALRLALCLLNFANSQGYTTVGVGRLMADTGRDRRNVQRALAELVDRGWLVRDPGAGTPGRGGRTCKTRLTLPGPTAGTGGGSSGERGGDMSPPLPAGDDRKGRRYVAPKGRRLSAAQTLLTHKSGADAPGLYAGGTAPTPEHAPAGSAAAVVDGIAGTLAQGFVLTPPPLPRSKDEILAELRAKFQTEGKWAYGRATNGAEPRARERRGHDRGSETK